MMRMTYSSYSDPGLSRCFFLILLLMLALAGCSGEKSTADVKKKKEPVPVLTAQARMMDVPVEMRSTGGVEAVQSSPVRAQVGGPLAEIHFQEGDFVKAGQILFVIDQAPFQASLNQLQAALARDEAQIKNAEAQLKNAERMAQRYEGLVQKDFVTREQYDQRLTNLAAASATLEASQATRDATRAAIESARITLGYTVIRSSVSGQTGSLKTKQGDLVKANDTEPLVVVNQIEPVRVSFTASEADLPEIMQRRQQGDILVLVRSPGVSEAREGRLVFVDNEVAKATATISLKAEFPNLDHALWPGQFVDVLMTLSTLKNAVVVPSAAVLTGQKGPYVFVVDGEGMVGVRAVKPGISAGQEQTVIVEGLAQGEKVVTDGQLRLVPGVHIIEKQSLDDSTRGGKSAAPEAGQIEHQAGAVPAATGEKKL